VAVVSREVAMFGLGFTELVILLIVVLLLFGPSRLPQLMESIGKSIQSFRKGLREPPEIDVTPSDENSEASGERGAPHDSPK
jgi:sec-independent protein translocase protein TatA